MDPNGSCSWAKSAVCSFLLSYPFFFLHVFLGVPAPNDLDWHSTQGYRYGLVVLLYDFY